MIDPATLNRRVTIERYTATDGQWGPDLTWSGLRTIWGAFKFDSADEQFAAGQIYTDRIGTVTIRFTRDLMETDRLVIEGVTYEIKGIAEIGNRDGLAVKVLARDPEAE